MVLTLKVLWGDPSSASCGSTTFCSKGHRDFTERLHCPCQPPVNVLLLAKKQPRMASYVLWIDGILGQVLSAYKFTFSVLCSITSQLSATLIVIRFFSFQLSYHPIGMNTYIKTVNREYISLFFVILEVNIKILFTSTKVSIWKQTYLLFFWYIQRVIWPADSLKPGFHNFSSVDYLMSGKDELTTSSHTTGCKSVCPGSGHSYQKQNSVCFRTLSFCHGGCKKRILSKYIKCNWDKVRERLR